MEQKLDAELSLSLSLSEEERMKDPVLRAGYEPATRIWTLILLYQGSLTEIQDNLSVSIIPLLGSFAIIRIPAEEIPTLLLYPQVLYLELPRPLYEDEITGISASCMAGAPFFPDGLTDRGPPSLSLIPGLITGIRTFAPIPEAPGFSLTGIRGLPMTEKIAMASVTFSLKMR